MTKQEHASTAETSITNRSHSASPPNTCQPTPANRRAKWQRELSSVAEDADMPAIKLGSPRLRLRHAPQGALEHPPDETRNADDPLRVTFDQAPNPPTVPRACRKTFFLGLGCAQVGKPTAPSLLVEETLRGFVIRYKHMLLQNAEATVTESPREGIDCLLKR